MTRPKAVQQKAPDVTPYTRDSCSRSSRATCTKAAPLRYPSSPCSRCSTSIRASGRAPCRRMIRLTRASFHVPGTLKEGGGGNQGMPTPPHRHSVPSD